VVRVTNQSLVKMTCQWDQNTRSATGAASPRESSTHVASATPHFAVFPESRDLNPEETVEFRVEFNPDRPQAFFCEELQCYCFEKTNRSFRLVDDEVFAPPQCLSITAYGHTWSSLEAHIPSAQLSQSSVFFPPAEV